MPGTLVAMLPTPAQGAGMALTLLEIGVHTFETDVNPRFSSDNHVGRRIDKVSTRSGQRRDYGRDSSSVLIR